MSTLEQEPTTRSIRLVRLVDDLSQQRALTMQVSRGTRVLAPSVHPAFLRNSESRKSSGRMVELSIQRDGINAISEGAYAWMGSVQFNSARGEETVGDVTLVQGKDGDITGTIRVGSEYYLVRPLDSGLHALVEVDESKYPSGGSSPLHDGGSSRKTSSRKASPSSSSSATREAAQAPKRSSEQACPASSASRTEPRSKSRAPSAQPHGAAPCPQLDTDVLVVYTAAAASGRNISNLINTAIQETNEAYDNSEAFITGLALAHSQQVGFNPTGDIGDDLDNLIANQTVQSLRNQHEADVVVLLTDNGYFFGGRQIIGVADEIRAEAGDAYAIVEAPFATGGSFTFAHEVGHLQGAQHHPSDDTCSPGDPECDTEGDIFPDAFGHRFEDNKWWCGWLCGPEYATIMANTLGGEYTHVKHFSNPNVDLDDEATGTGSRNNADALLTTTSTVEGFRLSSDLRASMTVSGGPPGVARIFSASPCGGTGSYSYEWRISLNAFGNFGPVLSTSETFFKKFPEGTHYVKLTVSSGSQTDVAVRSVTIDGGFKSPTAGSPSDSLAAKTATTGEGPTTESPERVALTGPAPNPVRSSAEIVYALPERTDVTLAVYDLMGRKVRQLAAGVRSAGTHRARLNGVALSSGVYIVRLRAGETQITEKITIVN